jgi:hypothetical protein
MSTYYELEQEIHYLEDIIKDMGDSEQKDALYETVKRLYFILKDLRQSQKDLKEVIQKVDDVLINRF